MLLQDTQVSSFGGENAGFNHQWESEKKWSDGSSAS